jgi:uncharacterized protein
VRISLAAYLSGALFGVGLGVSGMTHPSKVIGFLDVAGAWDPSLAFVMVGALFVDVALFRVILRLKTPLFAPKFVVPPADQRVDARLVGGAAIFGVGWGLGGFCPGPALVSLAGAAAPVFAFVAAMLASMAVYDALDRERASDATCPS